MGSLEEFDNVVRRYEKVSGKAIDEDHKVGVLQKNMKDQIDNYMFLDYYCVISIFPDGLLCNRFMW